MQDHQSVASEDPRPGHIKHFGAPPKATPLANIGRQFNPLQAEPRFLNQGIIPVLRTLAEDFINFSLILVFYLCCGSIGSVALMLDNIFNTRLFENFIRFVEHFDTGGLE